MKKYLFFFIASLLVISCKKSTVDGTSVRSMQKAINDIASDMPTLQQVKFNEALYIVKTFGVKGNDQSEKLKNLGELLNGKNGKEIFVLADEIAQKNSIDWSSSGPPSLGNMKIFDDEKVQEVDPNDVDAASLSLKITEVMKDSIVGYKGLRVVPRLLDSQNNLVNFSQAGLEANLEIYSGGKRISTMKNLILDNNFGGFLIKLGSISKEKVVDDTLDITVSVKTTKKTLKMSKYGIRVNSNALYTPQPVEIPQASVETDNEEPNSNSETSVVPDAETPKKSTIGDPKVTVSSFLGNLNRRNLKGAYAQSANPNWKNYDQFSNPVSGFGSVKSVSIKTISTPKVSDKKATVNAMYDVTDQEGKTTSLKVTFGLKADSNGEWKISSYKIN